MYSESASTPPLRDRSFACGAEVQDAERLHESHAAQRRLLEGQAADVAAEKVLYSQRLAELTRRKEALEQLEQEVQRRSKEHAEQVQRATAALEARDSDVRRREEQCRAAVEDIARQKALLARADAVCPAAFCDRR